MYAAQIDKLLEENARLRRALEGEIDPRLFGATSGRPSFVRRSARKIVPSRFHGPIARLLNSLKR